MPTMPEPITTIEGQPLKSLKIRELVGLVDGALNDLKAAISGLYRPTEVPWITMDSELAPDTDAILTTGVSLICMVHSILPAFGFDAYDIQKACEKLNRDNKAAGNIGNRPQNAQEFLKQVEQLNLRWDECIELLKKGVEQNG